MDVYDVNGIVVVASEIIKLVEEKGLLFTIFNPDMDIHFFIFVHGISVNFWKDVRVNHYYNFSVLKLGALQAYSGLKKLLLKSVSTSTFLEIECYQTKEFTIADNLKSCISVPSLHSLFHTGSNAEFNLVSYQGCVTEIKDSENGIYELDNKVLLYATFNFCSIPSNYLKIGTEVFASNVHLICSPKKNVLVCCGLSSVRKIVHDETQEEVNALLPEVNICLRYALSINDFLWFERLSIRLKNKLSSLVAEEDISLKRNSEFLVSILEFFISFKNETSIKKETSLVEEYFSNPHKCLAFSEDRFPTECDLPYLSDILEEAVDNLSWINISKNGKISIRNHDNLVLIGMLSISANGSVYIEDTTSKLPVILSAKCSNCSHEQSIISQFKNANVSFIVALFEYDIVFENIYCMSGTWNCLQYLRTSCCRLFPLATFHKPSREFKVPDRYLYKKYNCQEGDEIINITEDINFSPSLSMDNSSQTGYQRFLVLSNLWTVRKKILLCSRILILLFTEKTISISNTKLENDITDDPFNYYETGDDLEFADLINDLNQLCIEDKPRLGQLCLESADLFLFPGHTYISNIGSMIGDKSNYLINSDGMFSVMATSDLKVCHDANCLGNYDLEEIGVIKYCSVSEILSNKKVHQNFIVTGVLIDKFYEDSKHIHDRKAESSSTLCMIIRDNSSRDTIPIYVPVLPATILGLLPGSLLELYGFLCICSKKGNLYLKASSTFGIEVKNNQKLLNGTDSSVKENTSLRGIPEKKSSSNKIFQTYFRRLCFVVKIISAEIFTICAKCNWKSKETCSCLISSKVKIKMSALIDDGTQVLLATCSGETARKLLALNESEWIKLSSYVKQYQQALKFSDKMNPIKVSYLPVMNQVFYYYCCSKATCQQLLLECMYILNTDFNMMDVPFVWCKSVIDCGSRDLMSEFYMKLKDINTNVCDI